MRGCSDVEQDRRIDVALVVRAVDRGAVERQCSLRRRRATLDAGERQAEPHAAVAEDVEHAASSGRSSPAASRAAPAKRT